MSFLKVGDSIDEVFFYGSKGAEKMRTPHISQAENAAKAGRGSKGALRSERVLHARTTSVIAFIIRAISYHR